MNINDCKILICDDSILARKQIKDIVVTLGTPTILEASDGQSAIDLYKTEKPNLVFLDIVMPKKDGNIAIEEIMAFDSFFVCFQNGQKPMITLSYHLDLFGEGCFYS